MKPVLFIAFLALGPALAELTPAQIDGPVVTTVSSVDSVEALPLPAATTASYQPIRSASLTEGR